MSLFLEYERWIDGELKDRNTEHIPSIYKPKPKVVEGNEPEVAETDRQNRRALVELMLEHNITIPAKQFDKWRPTVRKTGRIDGVSNGLTCIATDGLQGYFLRQDREPLIGHVHWFKWDEPDVSYVPYIDEHGQKKFFKQVTDHGAPGALFKRPRKEREDSESKVKKVREPMTTAVALKLLEKLMQAAPKPQ